MLELRGDWNLGDLDRIYLWNSRVVQVRRSPCEQVPRVGWVMYAQVARYDHIVVVVSRPLDFNRNQTLIRSGLAGSYIRRVVPHRGVAELSDGPVGHPCFQGRQITEDLSLKARCPGGCIRSRMTRSASVVTHRHGVSRSRHMACRALAGSQGVSTGSYWRTVGSFRSAYAQQGVELIAVVCGRTRRVRGQERIRSVCGSAIVALTTDLIHKGVCRWSSTGSYARTVRQHFRVVELRLLTRSC